MSTVTSTHTNATLHGTAQAWTGRKGVSYDWQAVLAEVEAARLDSELASLTPLAGDRS